MSGSFVYDQAAVEAFCAELVRAGFSPAVGSEGHHWTGAIPESLKPLTDAGVMEIAITDGWPAVAAKAFVPGLTADHVLPKSGYICLWADDDPAQIHGQTWGAFSARLDRWAASAQDGFELEDRALDSWVLFPGIAAVRAELDLPALLGTPRNGDVHVVHGKSKAILTLTKNARDDHPLEGVVMYRDSVRMAPALSTSSVLLSRVGSGTISIMVLGGATARLKGRRAVDMTSQFSLGRSTGSLRRWCSPSLAPERSWLRLRIRLRRVMWLVAFVVLDPMPAFCRGSAYSWPVWERWAVRSRCRWRVAVLVSSTFVTMMISAR